MEGHLTPLNELISNVFVVINLQEIYFDVIDLKFEKRTDLCKIHLWTSILPRLLVVSLHYVCFTPRADWVSHFGRAFRCNLLVLNLFRV